MDTKANEIPRDDASGFKADIGGGNIATTTAGDGTQNTADVVKSLDKMISLLNARINTVREQRKICGEMSALAAQLVSMNDIKSKPKENAHNDNRPE